MATYDELLTAAHTDLTALSEYARQKTTDASENTGLWHLWALRVEHIDAARAELAKIPGIGAVIAEPRLVGGAVETPIDVSKTNDQHEAASLIGESIGADARLASEAALPTWTPDEETDPLEPLAVDARVAVDVWAAEPGEIRPVEGVTVEPLPPSAEYVRLTGTRAALAAMLTDQWSDDPAWVAATVASAEVLPRVSTMRRYLEGDTLDPRCTGYIDELGYLAHDGDTCPVHESGDVDPGDETETDPNEEEMRGADTDADA